METRLVKIMVCAAVVLLTLSDPARAAQPDNGPRQAGKSPIKVFILAGQSNMAGQGAADNMSNTGRATPVTLMKDPVKHEVLPGTHALDWTGQLDVRMNQQAHRFIERKIEQSMPGRARYWNRDLKSREAYEKSVAPNRERFLKIIGVVDRRVPVRMERFGSDGCPALVAETATYTIYQVRWPVLTNIYEIPVVFGEGLLLEPKGKPKGHIVAVPDADNPPEQIAGLAPGLGPESQYARRLAENGFEVVVPMMLNRSTFGPAGQSSREWIYRQAIHLGRHVIGYEVQKVLAAVDWFESRREPNAKIGVVGFREGGLIAFYAAAADTRIDATLVSGYFDSRQKLGLEPLYRNVWGLLREFGDAEIATLIAPRGLVVEHSAAPGESPGETVRSEFDRIIALTAPGFQPLRFIAGASHAPMQWISQESFKTFADMLGVASPMELCKDAPQDARTKLDAEARHRQQVRGMEDHVQGLLAVSLSARNDFFLNKVGVARGLSNFVEQSKRYRQYLWEEVLGRIEDPYLPLNPRSRHYKDDPKWVAYDVVLDVWPDVFAWGILLRPRDIQAQEKRPVVVVQPGLECLPHYALDRTMGGTWGVAARLADRGFVVFVPQNLYRGGDNFRMLDKKARGIKASMWSLMIGQHHQILTWLETLPYVDASRIGFYGCSYGGTTAMYVVPVLEKYRLAICSANFNEWAGKIAATRTAPNGYMLGGQWELAFFDMGNTFSHAEMAYLMVPRPFMVERGMSDGVAQDFSVALEYAKVRRLYMLLGLADKTEIEIKDGPHGFLCDGAFKFLHKHLNWPVRSD